MLRGPWLLAPLAVVMTAWGCLDWGKLESGRCGDGFVGPEERCDDGNRKSGDGCDADCELEEDACVQTRDGSAGMCDAGVPEVPDGGCDGGCSIDPNALCGNATVDADEECDDGNTSAGDGCDERCRKEPERPLCGNGKLDGDEVCDDANDSNMDACLNGCSRATCGDGQVRAHVEECDVVSGGDVASCKKCLLCPAEPAGHFNARTGHCYTRHTERVSAGAARQICQAEGGDLWTVTSAAEGNTVVGRLKLSGTQWLGRVRTAGNDGSWVTGESSAFTNYADGEPRLPNGACVALFADGTANAWRSETCASPQSFVCERAPASVSLPSNKAYKIRTANVTADEARSRCLTEGGQLVALETPEEQAYVAGITDLIVWVDANEVSEGMFAWSNATPIAPEAIQIDDTNATQACLTLDVAGQLTDRACAETSPFVCEFD